MTAFKKLVQHYQMIDHFSHVSSICHWDQAAMMPAGGNEVRSNAMATLSLHIHQLSTDKSLKNLFQQAEELPLSEIEKRHLTEMKRAYRMATVLPDELVSAQSLAGSKCEHAWRQQRQSNDWQGFCENFETVVALSQEEAQLRAAQNKVTPYDAMLDIYEPSMTTEKIDHLFGDLKSWLPDLTQEVLQKQKKESIQLPSGQFTIDAQKALGLEVMQHLGFDFNHGRLDISMHPFCGGVSQDVRITTRYDESDFQQSLMGIIHETGHACYEQGLPKEFLGLPSGKARSMGIHESQSLFFEMQLGRSRSFIEAIAPIAARHFAQAPTSIFSAQNLHQIYTRVQPDFIRVDADELTYPAHIILRYEIERDLINREISYLDIPELWQTKMQEYLGVNTKGNYKNGCMQDIHWTDGAFGYFPSYTLGAMYAAQFMVAMRKDVDVEACLRSLQLNDVTAWLNQHIWSKASLYSIDEILCQATGETLNTKYYQQHLIERYLK